MFKIITYSMHRYGDNTQVLWDIKTQNGTFYNIQNKRKRIKKLNTAVEVFQFLQGVPKQAQNLCITA